MLRATAALVPEGGYLAVHAYLSRHDDAELEELRADLADLVGRPVTFGWGPRFLHSTGQFHKGGPAVGVFLQITGDAGGTSRCPAARSPWAGSSPRRPRATPGCWAISAAPWSPCTCAAATRASRP